MGLDEWQEKEMMACSPRARFAVQKAALSGCFERADKGSRSHT
jgi:hypothetical protein